MFVPVLLFGLAFSPFAVAADPIASGDYASGSTGRANPRSLSAIITSPGVIGLERQYTLGGSARFGPQKGRSFQAGASDSVTGPVALGVMWAGEWSSPPVPDEELPGWRVAGQAGENPTEETTIGGAIGGALAQRRVGVGLGVSYHRYKSFYRDPSGLVDLSAGVSGKLGDQVVLAASVRDFLPSADFTKAPLVLEGGIRWGPSPWLGIEADVWSDMQTLDEPALSIGVGGVAWAARTVPIRLGYTRDGIDDLDILTAGIGAGSESGSLEYAVGVPIQAVDPGAGTLGTWHGVSLVVHF